MYSDSDHVPADFTVVDVTRDADEPDISKMTKDQISEFDAYQYEALERDLSHSDCKIMEWIETEHQVVAGETVLMTGYVARVAGRDRQYVAVRRRMAGRNICIIGTFDVRRTDDFMHPILEMLGRVRAMIYRS